MDSYQKGDTRRLDKLTIARAVEANRNDRTIRQAKVAPLNALHAVLSSASSRFTCEVLYAKGPNTRKVDVAVLAFICYEINPCDVAKIIGSNGDRTASTSAQTTARRNGRSLGFAIFRENLPEVAIQRYTGEGGCFQFASARYGSRQHKRYHLREVADRYGFTLNTVPQCVQLLFSPPT